MLIHNFLENSADLYPDKTAVIHGNKRFNYLEIEQKANSIANWLLKKGVQRGHRVALLLRNSIEYIYGYYGVQKVGAIVVPLNTGLEVSELSQMLDNCAPVVIISEKFFSEKILQINENKKYHFEKILFTNGESICFDQIFQLYSSKRPTITLIDKDISSIIYTSGSTGGPKGVTLSHLNLVANTHSILSYLKLTSKDRVMAVLPFYYVYGKTLLNLHFAVSGSIIIDNRFAFPNAVLKTMNQEKATGFSGVPSTFSILVNRSSIGKMDFPFLKYITQAGGHMNAEIKKRLISLFPDKKIYIMYGATEASSRLSYLEPDMVPRHMKSIGKAIPNVELDIFDENGREVSTGEEGEIVARGSNIMQGYWKLPEETKKVLKNGWYYTGDFGIKDVEGYIYVTGRKKEVIKTGIYKVNAKEIEEVLLAYPGVIETAVVGVEDDVLGEAIKAFVVTDRPLVVRDIIRFCKNRLDNYKVPGKIERIDNLPKNESGKVLKLQLVKL